jgi:site-specific recombinase XerD|nr:site-specific integrase [uncultured Lachnoclostridium sp.]
MKFEKLYTLGDCFDLFMLDLEGRCSPKTIDNYDCHLRYFRQFIESELSAKANNIKINTIKITDLHKYVKMLRGRKKCETHLYKPTENKPVTMTTIRDYCLDIKTFFSFCYKNDYMDYDITKNWKLVKREPVEKLPLYQHEVDLIESIFKRKTENNIRNLCILHCGLDAGMRSSEVINLKLKDINWKTNYICIEAGKGFKTRYIPLSLRLKDLLLKYKLTYRYQNNDPNSYFFFQLASQEPINDNVMKQVYARIKKRTEVNRLNHHLLRHTFASSFMCGGGNLETLRDILGHSSYNVTQIYLHMSNKYKSLSSDIYHLDRRFMDIYYHGR